MERFFHNPLLPNKSKKFLFGFIKKILFAILQGLITSFIIIENRFL